MCIQMIYMYLYMYITYICDIYHIFYLIHLIIYVCLTHTRIYVCEIPYLSLLFNVHIMYINVYIK